MRSLAKSEGDEMLHVAFHQGIHCLLSHNNLQENEYDFIWQLWPLDIYNIPFQAYSFQPEGRIH